MDEPKSAREQLFSYRLLVGLPSCDGAGRCLELDRGGTSTFACFDFILYGIYNETYPCHLCTGMAEQFIAVVADDLAVAADHRNDIAEQFIAVRNCSLRLGKHWESDGRP